MKVRRTTLMSFLVGAAISAATTVAYGACAANIWVQSSTDCHVYDRYELVGENCGDGVCVCAYLPSGGSQHIEEGPCAELPIIM